MHQTTRDSERYSTPVLVKCQQRPSPGNNRYAGRHKLNKLVASDLFRLEFAMDFCMYNVMQEQTCWSTLTEISLDITSGLVPSDLLYPRTAVQHKTASRNHHGLIDVLYS